MVSGGHQDVLLLGLVENLGPKTRFLGLPGNDACNVLCGCLLCSLILFQAGHGRKAIQCDIDEVLAGIILDHAVADARHGCSAQRIELLAIVDQVAQSGVDCVNRTAVGGHEEARQSVAHAPVVGEHLEHVAWRHFRSDDNVLNVHQVETGFGQLEGVAVLGADEDDRGFEGLLGFAGDLSQSSLGCLCFGIVAVIGECQVRFVDDDGGVVALLLDVVDQLGQTLCLSSVVQGCQCILNGGC
mmetsp:Transcript_122545/g.172521  ORF Transcript_122545/g.172521 Transcript_122545/m.172521 type:complete len:242 (-) Transcript_122545:779-1504(-)